MTEAGVGVVTQAARSTLDLAKAQPKLCWITALDHARRAKTTADGELQAPHPRDSGKKAEADR